jgi:hypothetical protein
MLCRTNIILLALLGGLVGCTGPTVFESVSPDGKSKLRITESYSLVDGHTSVALQTGSNETRIYFDPADSRFEYAEVMWLPGQSAVAFCVLSSFPPKNFIYEPTSGYLTRHARRPPGSENLRVDKFNLLNRTDSPCWRDADSEVPVREQVSPPVPRDRQLGWLQRSGLVAIVFYAPIPLVAWWCLRRIKRLDGSRITVMLARVLLVVSVAFPLFSGPFGPFATPLSIAALVIICAGIPVILATAVRIAERIENGWIRSGAQGFSLLAMTPFGVILLMLLIIQGSCSIRLRDQHSPGGQLETRTAYFGQGALGEDFVQVRVASGGLPFPQLSSRELGVCCRTTMV